MTRKEAIKILKDSMAGRMVLYKDSIQATQMAIAALEKSPHWISVEDELPPRDTFFNMSKMKKEHIEKFNLEDKELDTSIGCLVVIRGGMLGLSNYNYQAKAWGIACGEEITHWMPLPQPPVVSNSEKTGNNEKGGQQ